MPFSIAFRTRSLDLLRNELGIELRRFHRAQLEKMKTATKIVQRAVREESREAFEQHSGHLARGISRRVRRMGQGEFAGFIFPTRRAFYAKFLEFGAIGPGTRILPSVPFFEPAADQTEVEVITILGESFNVFRPT